MSKNLNSSYEGFRRKNSLTSMQTSKTPSPADLSFLKFRHNEHLSEVENLSIQLDSLSKRSLSSRRFNEEKPKHSLSSTNIVFIDEEVTQNRYFHPLKKEECTSRMEEEVERLGGQKRKEKTSSSAIFNKFDIIQEDHYLNEEEEGGSIEPVTFKNPSAKNTERKGIQKTTAISKNAPQPAKKTVKIESVTVFRKDKIKLEMGELDKMQKELDSKRGTREATAREPARGNPNTSNPNINRKGREGPKESFKMAKAEQKPESRKLTKSSSILLGAKMVESKQEVDGECIPTRMLSEKEKGGLVARVEELRQIIDKNDICAQNLEEVLGYFEKIGKLLTK